MAKSKASKSSTQAKAVPITTFKSWRLQKEERGDYGFQTSLSKEEIIDLGKELVRWATEEIDKPNSRRLSLRRFWIEKGFHIDTAAEWCLRIPEFKSLHEFAKLALGTKREDGMLLKELEPKNIAYTLHHYLPEWKAMDSYHDDRKKITDTIAALLGKTFNVGSLDESERPDEVDKDKQ